MINPIKSEESQNIIHGITSDSTMLNKRQIRSDMLGPDMAWAIYFWRETDDENHWNFWDFWRNLGQTHTHKCKQNMVSQTILYKKCYFRGGHLSKPKHQTSQGFCHLRLFVHLASHGVSHPLPPLPSVTRNFIASLGWNRVQAGAPVS